MFVPEIDHRIEWLLMDIRELKISLRRYTIWMLNGLDFTEVMESIVVQLDSLYKQIFALLRQAGLGEGGSLLWMLTGRLRI